MKAHDDARSEALVKGCSTSPVSCPGGVDPTHLQWLVDGEHAMNALGAIFVATGSAAVIGGLVWHYLEPAQSTRQLALQPTAGGGMLSFTARF